MHEWKLKASEAWFHQQKTIIYEIHTFLTFSILWALSADDKFVVFFVCFFLFFFTAAGVKCHEAIIQCLLILHHGANYTYFIASGIIEPILDTLKVEYGLPQVLGDVYWLTDYTAVYED